MSTTSGDSLSVRTEAPQVSGAGSEPAPRTSERKFCGWGNVEIRDKAGEKLKAEEIADSMKSYFERGAPIILAHSNKVVGKGDSWQVAKNDKGHLGIRLCGHVFDHYTVDDKTWTEMKSGKLAMLSIGGDITEKKKECKGKACSVLLLGPEVHEFSLVPSGMNQESHIDFVNTMAKADTEEDTVVKMELEFFTEKARNGCSLRSREACGQCEFLDYCLNPYGGKKGEEKMAEKADYGCGYCGPCRVERNKSVKMLLNTKDSDTCYCPQCGATSPSTRYGLKEDTQKGPRDSSCDNCALRDNCREARFGQGHKCRAWMYAVEDSAKMEKAEADCIMALMIRHDDMDIDEAVRICDKEESNSQKSREELDITVKEYITAKAESGSEIPDAWAMVKACPHCERFVTDFVKAGKGTLTEAVQALASSLDKTYKEVKRVAENTTKTEPAPTLTVEQMAKALQTIGVRLEALEKILSAKQEPAPQAPAPAPCPPGQKPGPDGQCVPAEAGPAPEQKAEKPVDPAVGIDERIEKAITKALSAKGMTVSTPRPEIAKEDTAPNAEGKQEIELDPKAMADSRRSRRVSAFV